MLTIAGGCGRHNHHDQPITKILLPLHDKHKVGEYVKAPSEETHLFAIAVPCKVCKQLCIYPENSEYGQKLSNEAARHTPPTE